MGAFLSGAGGALTRNPASPVLVVIVSLGFLARENRYHFLLVAFPRMVKGSLAL